MNMSQPSIVTSFDASITEALSVQYKLPNLKGGWHENIFYWLFLNLGSSYIHIIFWRFFALQLFCRKRGQFPLIIACAFAPSGCGARRARFRRDVRKGTLNESLSVKKRGVGYHER